MYYCNECGERLNSEDEAVQHFVEAHRDVLLAMFILVDERHLQRSDLECIPERNIEEADAQ